MDKPVFILKNCLTYFTKQENVWKNDMKSVGEPLSVHNMNKILKALKTKQTMYVVRYFNATKTL